MFGPAFSGINAGFVNLFLRNLAKGFALPHFSYDRFFLSFPILPVIQFLRQVSDFGEENALKIKLGYRRLKCGILFFWGSGIGKGKESGLGDGILS